MKKRFVIFALLLSSAYCSEYFYENGELQVLTPVSANSTANSMQVRSINSDEVQWYRTANGHEVGVDQEIVVKWSDRSAAESVLKEFGLVIEENLTSSITLIVVPDGQNVFEISRALYENSATEYSQPNMISPRSMR